MESVIKASETAVVHRPAIERVISEMRNVTDGPLSLEEMSEVAYLSPYHFARTFRKITGVAPGEFMTSLRVERAKRLLLKTDLNVGEVCFEVGYNSLGTFTTRFTRLVGLSPSRLRHLPEEAAPVLDLLTSDSSFSPPSSDSYSVTDTHGGVSGRIVASDTREVLIFVGLFPGAIPQRRPVAGTILTSPGAYRLPPVPDGCYQLMAAALPRHVGPLAFLLPDGELRRRQEPGPGRGTHRQDQRPHGRHSTPTTKHGPSYLGCAPRALARTSLHKNESKIEEVGVVAAKYPLSEGTGQERRANDHQGRNGRRDRPRSG